MVTESSGNPGKIHVTFRPGDLRFLQGAAGGQPNLEAMMQNIAREISMTMNASNVRVRGGKLGNFYVENENNEYNITINVFPNAVSVNFFFVNHCRKWLLQHP